MYKNATKCNETIGKWCKNKHGASKIIDTYETYQSTEAKDGSDACHDRARPTSDQGAFPTKGSEAKGRAYASQMPVQGGKALYKA
jgi:hypothetical protein